MTFLRNPHNQIATFLFIVLAAVLGACSFTPGGQEAAQPKTQVTYNIGWTHEFSSAGFYAAEKNGHFAEQGLEVELQEGGFKDNGLIDPIAEVLAGNADFGAESITSILAARAEGKPIVGVAVIYQRSPFALISQAEKNITRPGDLLGKKVAIADSAWPVYKAFLATQGIDPSQITIVPRTSFGIDPLVNDEVDALAGWIINEGVLMEEAGLESNFILLNDYGVDTYQSVIFTTEDMIANQPDVIERFLRAAIKGYQDVVANPNQAIDYTLAYNDQLDKAQQLRRLQAALPLINPAGSSIGKMEPQIWELTYQILQDNQVLNTPVDIQAAYTLQFLDTIYSNLQANQ